MRLSSDPAARRRLAALVASAVVAFLAGLAVGAGGGGRGDGGGEPAERRRRPPALEAAERLDGRRQIGQLLITRYVGSTPPPYLLRSLREGRAGGVILFADNVDSPAGLRRATAALQRAARGSALVAADQEGGQIRTLPWAPPAPGQAGQATPTEAGAEAKRAAAALRFAGVNVTLAPVADVAAGPSSVVAARAYPGDGRGVAALVQAALRGYASGRVAATVKHFPGIGAATASTDDAPVTIDRPRSELERSDLAPFRAAAADAPLVMAGHALYPALDRRRIASQSPAILGGLLRGALRFRGAVITDSMEAEAVLSRSTVEVAAVRAVAAGADLLLLTGPGSYRPVLRRLEAEAANSPRFRARVAEAAGRVLELKRRLGLR